MNLSENDNWLTIVVLWVLGFVLSTPRDAFAADYEYLLEMEGEHSQPTELVEQMEELLRHPLDLNEATISELERIPHLTPTLAREIVELRERVGNFKAIEELLSMDGIDDDLLHRIREFITVKEKGGIRWRGTFRSRLTCSWPEARGYQEGTYIGNSLKLYNRATVEMGDHLEVGFTTEKDPGEASMADLVHCHLRIRRLSFIDQALVGHYGLEFGRGLILWTGYGALKGGQVVNAIKKGERGVRPFTSANEVQALRGICGRFSFPSLQFFLFTSDRHVDANLNDDGTISGIDVTGLHRTESEIEKRGRLRERAQGFRMIVRLPFGSVGSTSYRVVYSPALENHDVERRYFALRGSKNSVAGMDVDVHLGALNFFGEMARSGNGGSAWIWGSIGDFGPLKMAVHHRHYGVDFQNLRSASFSEADVCNEDGFYFGVTYRPRRGTSVELFLDQFRHFWRRYFEPMPSGGAEFYCQVEQRVSQGLTLAIRSRWERKEVSASATDRWGRETSKCVQRQRQGLRAQLDWEPSWGIRLRGRWESIRLSHGGSPEVQRGALLFSDLRFRPSKRVEAQGRVIFFQTEERLYEYESDLPGSMSTVGLSGRGRRWYFLLKVDLFWALRLSARYGSTYNYGAESMGSGLNERKGDTENSFGVQVDLGW